MMCEFPRAPSMHSVWLSLLWVYCAFACFFCRSCHECADVLLEYDRLSWFWLGDRVCGQEDSAGGRKDLLPEVRHHHHDRRSCGRFVAGCFVVLSSLCLSVLSYPVSLSVGLGLSVCLCLCLSLRLCLGLSVCRCLCLSVCSVCSEYLSAL